MKGVVLGFAVAISMIGCFARSVPTPRLTGTCAGACAHYVECKPSRGGSDRARCLTECPDVFNDSDSLMAFESLQCEDAVEYVDGSSPRTAATPRS